MNQGRIASSKVEKQNKPPSGRRYGLCTTRHDEPFVQEPASKGGEHDEVVFFRESLKRNTNDMKKKEIKFVTKKPIPF